MSSRSRAALLLLAAFGCGHAPNVVPPAICRAAEPCALDRLAPLLDSAITARAAAGGVIAVSYHGARFVYGAGKLALDDPRRPDGNTIYDLASLTKVIATTTLAMEAVSEGKLDLDAPVVRYLPAFGGPGKERVTIRHLLTHSSGLRADRALWRQSPNADSALKLVNATPLDTAPGVRMVYSDLGAIVLGEVLERIYGTSLRWLWLGRIAEPLGLASTRFLPPEDWWWRVAATENDTVWRKKIVRGRVHDEKAEWLGGVAGHAGLFGSATDLLTFGEWLLAARSDAQTCTGTACASSRLRVRPSVAQEFTRRQDLVPGSSRALGWDTPSEGSSAGTHLGPGAFGHTGFTGTSMWVDPSRELVIVLLTNRVHPTRDNPRIGPLRIAVANAVVTMLTGAR